MSGTTTTGPRALKRGAYATPAHILAGAMPHAPTAAAIAATPPDHIVIPKKISMWHNDQYGDCVTAEEAFAKACHSPEIFITDKEVYAWAEQHGVLNGAYLYQVLQWMQKGGFKQNGHTYDDGKHYAIDWHNHAHLTSAIAAGPVKIGVGANQLETTWHQHGGRNGWFATGYHAEASEDHCVSLCGYGTMTWLAGQLKVPVPHGVDGKKPGYAMFTWDSIGIIDQPSMLAITFEAWLRSPTTKVQ